MPLEVILKRFEQPDEVREFTRGRFELTPGSLFYVPAEPHDSWVIGDKPYVSLHFLGASHYAK